MSTLGGIKKSILVVLIFLAKVKNNIVRKFFQPTFVKDVLFQRRGKMGYCNILKNGSMDFADFCIPANLSTTNYLGK